MSCGDTDISSGSDSSDTEESTATHFVPGDNDEEELWDAIEILEEKGNMYKVRWDGIDKTTGKPWPPSWTYKHDCNNQLIRSWKKKKEEMKKRRKSTAKSKQARSSAASAKNKKRSESTSTVTATRQSRRNTKDSTPSTPAGASARAPSPRVPPPNSKASKRRASARDFVGADVSEAQGESSRPRKRRKVEVEIITSSPARSSPPPEPSHEVQPSSRQPARKSISQSDDNVEAGPSKPSGRIALQGRPSANDTFSREGIVPETQSPDRQTLHSSPHNAPVVEQNLPSTPPRAQRSSTSQTASSIKARMKRKRTSTKELRPVPALSPSAFRAYLPSADEEEIEQFSSPEKDTSRRKALTLDVPTQDTIEEAEFTQAQEPIDVYMDWEGGAQPDEDPFEADDDGPALSLGPALPAPDEEHGSRQAMSAVLSTRPSSRQERPAEAPESPEIPVSQELPATSTTQRAEVDSQSQLSLNGQIAELNAALEEKDEQLSQLELQMEDLQSRIAELEAESTEVTAKHQAELKALQEASDDKTEQISQLESQLVELQLQLTQQASESDNERERHELQMRELNETLEERNEQISQLENALVELQTEMAEAIAERLAATQQQVTAEDDKHAELLAAAQGRVTTLEQELTSVRERLSKAEDETNTLTARLEASTQEWERRFKNTESDRDMFKDLYSEASTHAARLAKENTALEERATIAEGQVRDGLAMIRGTFEEQARKLRAEAEKWEALCKVLQEKDARTDDEVRRRAALEPRLREENARLKEEAEVVRADMVKMAGIIAQMTEQRGRSEEAAGMDVDADADAEGDADEDGDAGEDSSPWHGKVFRDVNGRHPGGPRASPRASSAADESKDDPEVVWYVCKHVRDGVMCHERFATPEEVVQHAQKTHYSELTFTEA